MLMVHDMQMGWRIKAAKGEERKERELKIRVGSSIVLNGRSIGFFLSDGIPAGF